MERMHNYRKEMTMDKKLQEQGNATRKRIYDFLVEFITMNGYSPTIREICSGIGLNSTATVHNHLLILERLGMIHMKENAPRTISLVGYKFVKVD